MQELKRHIRKCNKTERRYNFLGLVENRDLTPDVENLFKFTTPTGYTGYDWVKGNVKLADLIMIEKD